MWRAATRHGIPGLVGLVAACAGMLAVAPLVFFRYYSPEAHAVADTTVALASMAAAGLVFGRMRERAQSTDAAILVGLVLLATTTLVFGVLPEVVREIDADTLSPWLPIAGRVAGAACIAAGAVIRPRALRNPGRAAARMTAAAVLLLLLLAASLLVAHLTRWTGGAPSDVSFRDIPSAFVSGPLSGVQTVAAVVWLVAASGFYRRGRAGDELMLWFSAGSALSAFAAFQYALAPTLYTEWLSPGDVFRVLSHLVLFGGVAREVRRYQQLETKIAVERERRRLARDVHDGVLQELAQIVLLADAEGPGLDDATRRHVLSSARRGLAELRGAVHALATADDTLEASIRRVVAAAATGTDVDVDVDVEPGIVLRAAIRDAFVRATREAVANAIRHGRPRTVRVEIRGDSPASLRVVDDGVGFESGARLADGSGFGLISMTERIEAVGGRIRVTSRPGRGTVVEAVVP